MRPVPDECAICRARVFRHQANRESRVPALGANRKRQMKQTKHTSFTVLYHCKRVVESTSSHL